MCIYKTLRGRTGTVNRFQRDKRTGGVRGRQENWFSGQLFFSNFLAFDVWTAWVTRKRKPEEALDWRPWVVKGNLTTQGMGKEGKAKNEVEENQSRASHKWEELLLTFLAQSPSCLTRGKRPNLRPIITKTGYWESTLLGLVDHGETPWRFLQVLWKKLKKVYFEGDF